MDSFDTLPLLSAPIVGLVIVVATVLARLL